MEAIILPSCVVVGGSLAAGGLLVEALGVPPFGVEGPGGGETPAPVEVGLTAGLFVVEGI